MEANKLTYKKLYWDLDKAIRTIIFIKDFELVDITNDLSFECDQCIELLFEVQRHIKNKELLFNLDTKVEIIKDDDDDNLPF